MANITYMNSSPTTPFEQPAHRISHSISKIISSPGLNKETNREIINEKKTCKCGQYDHERTNFSSCILNKKNIKNIDQNTLKSILDNQKKYGKDFKYKDKRA